jgi:hypothetical protein
MPNNHIVLIDYSDGTNEYREFESYAMALSFLKKVLEPDENVEYAQIVRAEHQYSWSNPNCSPEGDF